MMSVKVERLEHNMAKLTFGIQSLLKAIPKETWIPG